MSIVLDNGAYTLKVGRETEEMPFVIPNSITRSKTERRRNFISNQVEECKDLSGLFYLLPFQKGYLVNWDTQRQIWDYVFNEGVLGIKPPDTNLIFTEPLFNFTSIQDTLDEILFEEYKFKSVLRVPAPLLSYCNYDCSKHVSCGLVVDSGYSFTHITPIYRGKVVMKGVVRIDVGGKLLTNHLKEIVSYRQLHVMDETCVMNQVKEDVCYVSLDFYADMEKTRKRSNSIQCEYVLPNFSDRKRGYVKEPVKTTSERSVDEQSLILANERISIPELLFSPSNVGINQMGIAEAIVHSISSTPSEMHPHLYANIILTGGNCMFDGFRSRVEAEVRKMAPDIFGVDVFLPDDPVCYAWKGGAAMSSKKLRPAHIVPVSSSDYKEHGHTITTKRFVDNLSWI